MKRDCKRKLECEHINCILEAYTDQVASYAYMFNTPIVLFYDGKVLVKFHFTSTPLSTQLQTLVVEHGHESPISIQHAVLCSICQGLDLKVNNWM